MPIFYLLFIIVVASSLFFMIVWVGVTVYRLYFPEQPLRRSSLLARWGPREERLPTGVREIRHAQRRSRRRSGSPSVHYVAGEPHTLPKEWRDELWHRRN